LVKLKSGDSDMMCHFRLINESVTSAYLHLIDYPGKTTNIMYF